MGAISVANWISRHIDDDGQQNQGMPWVAKSLATRVGVGFAMISYNLEKVTPHHHSVLLP